MTTILTPYSRGEATVTGSKKFRKQLLPIGEIEYEGQMVKFDKPFLEEVVSSFRNRAYDQVPFQLANDKNEHTNNPERFRGEIEDLTLEPDGLYMTVSTTKEGAKVIKDNPKLGVSARIVNAFKRADGKFFKSALQHALGTLDPKVTGMGPWIALEAANAGDIDVIDLTQIEYREDNGVAGKQLTEDELAKLRALLAGSESDEDELTDEQVAELIAAADALEPDDDEDEDESDEDEDTDLTDEELEAILAGDEEPVTVSAANDPALQRALALSNEVQSAQAMELSRITRELDAGRYEQERELFARQYGIPPSVTDLARELLEGNGHVINLSNGGEADAGAIVRRLLTTIGGHVKLMDLSVELGSPFEDVAGEDDDQTKREDWASSYRAQYGL